MLNRIQNKDARLKIPSEKSSTVYALRLIQLFGVHNTHQPSSHKWKGPPIWNLDTKTLSYLLFYVAYPTIAYPLQNKRYTIYKIIKVMASLKRTSFFKKILDVADSKCRINSFFIQISQKDNQKNLSKRGFLPKGQNVLACKYPCIYYRWTYPNVIVTFTPKQCKFWTRR